MSGRRCATRPPAGLEAIGSDDDGHLAKTPRQEQRLIPGLLGGKSGRAAVRDQLDRRSRLTPVAAADDRHPASVFGKPARNHLHRRRLARAAHRQVSHGYHWAW